MQLCVSVIYIFHSCWITALSSDLLWYHSNAAVPICRKNDVVGFFSWLPFLTTVPTCISRHSHPSWSFKTVRCQQNCPKWCITTHMAVVLNGFRMGRNLLWQFYHICCVLQTKPYSTQHKQTTMGPIGSQCKLKSQWLIMKQSCSDCSDKWQNSWKRKEWTNLRTFWFEIFETDWNLDPNG